MNTTTATEAEKQCVVCDLYDGEDGCRDEHQRWRDFSTAEQVAHVEELHARHTEAEKQLNELRARHSEVHAAAVDAFGSIYEAMRAADRERQRVKLAETVTEVTGGRDLSSLTPEIAKDLLMGLRDAEERARSGLVALEDYCRSAGLISDDPWAWHPWSGQRKSPF